MLEQGIQRPDRSQLLMAQMNSPPLPFSGAGAAPDDPELDRVASAIRAVPNMEMKFGTALRMALDEVIDPRSGRYSIHQLAKTEKAYLGTKVEIIVRAALALDPGNRLDYGIDGIDVDAKFSIAPWRWMIPTEAIGQLCLVMHADDDRARFQVGVVRATADKLSPGTGNKDKKRQLLAAARWSIQWIVEEGNLPENFVLGLEPSIRDRVLKPPGARYGQERVNRLLRLVQDTVIPRTAIETVAQQLDPMKRVRDARKVLEAEGVFVLGGQEADHKAHARAVGLPVPKKGETISTARRP